MIKALFLTLLLFPIVSNANNWDYEYCEKEDLGWNFYCDPDLRDQDPQDSRKIQSKSDKQEQTKELNPKERLAKIRERLENLQALSILEPTKKNILAYERYKNAMYDRVTEVTQKTTQLIWQTPELNYSLKHPVSTIGKRIYNDEVDTKEKKRFNNLHKEYGIIYFMRGGCPYCQKFSPVIKRFGDDYNITIKVISTDGTGTGTFADFITDDGHARKFNVQAVPAVYLYRSSDQLIIPISTGFIARDDLENRIFKLTEEGVLDG